MRGLEVSRGQGLRVLVLGANGFIGSHVLRGLKSQLSLVGADVASSSGVGCLKIDALSPDFSHLIEQAEADVIVNCSGAANVPASFEQPLHDFTLNTLRIAQLLDAIRTSKRDIRLVHLSSAAVYGDPGRAPVAEATPAAPLSPYGWHKRQAELVCEEYARVYGVKTISLRIFSAYGPGLRKQLFWDLYQKSIRSPCVELSGTGDETRDFIYVDDVVAAIDHAICKASFDGRAVNVANGKAITVREAATTMLGHLDKRCSVVFSGNARRGDPEFWQADISYLRSLGFVPQFDIQRGLGRTARWIVEQT